ncbi:MAG: serine hydrolase domain-containing protein [Pseudomonadota bacterium]
MRNVSIAILLCAYLAGCASSPPVQGPVHEETSLAVGASLDALVPELIEEEKAAGVGIAVIRGGEFVWQGYYGEQGPGIAVNTNTVFNTASVAKTITAETLIALSAKGLIDLDEPIAAYVDHPDLSIDPRYSLLTARLLLSHRAGLLNWAYAYEDGVLAFDHDPDTRFSYSGAGIELAARYASAKVGQPLQELAFEHVLGPAGIREMSMGMIAEWTVGRITTPMDAEGSYRPIAELNESLARGDANSAADDLLSTVPAYAKLITALLESSWLSEAQIAERERIITSLAQDDIYQCPELSWLTCPTQFGHGLGWQVFEYADHKVLKHSGSDAGENAMVYYSPNTRNGAVIFVNGANGWVVMTRIIEAIGDEPLIADYYRGLIETVMGRPMPPLVEPAAE